MTDHSGLPLFPNSWYVFASSSELPRGKLLSSECMGQPVTVFRTESGQAFAVDSYYPHIGAHFGYCGFVEGEALQ